MSYRCYIAEAQYRQPIRCTLHNPVSRIDVKYNAMFILITFILLFLSISAIIGLRLTRRGNLHTWLITVGILLTWVSVLLWQFNLPWNFIPGQWMSVGLFNASPQLFANPIAWLYALSLIALAAAVILTSPTRPEQIGTRSWAETLALTGIGLMIILVDNPLGLALAWMAIDLAEFVLIVRKKAIPNERDWLAFTLRLIATAFILWAGVVGTSASGQSFTIETTPAQAGLFLVIAAGLRLAALPFRLTQKPQESTPQRGFDTIFSTISALTGLMVLARIPAASIDANWLTPLLTLTTITALFNGWKWLFAPDELSARHHWLMGMSALSLAACLSNNPLGTAAWGVCLILFGGILFLYASKQIWLTRILALASLFILSFPFTLTATVWLGTFPLPFLFLPLLALAQALFIAGYLRHLLRPSEINDFSQLPNWSQTTYALGLGLLVLTALLGSLWGWPGALAVGHWVISLAMLPLIAATLFASYRLPQLAFIKIPQIGLPKNRPLRLPSPLHIFGRIFSFFYQIIGSLTIYISDLLEGDGGLLWTLLLLILLISFLRGR